jgi:acetate kinase
MILTINAGSSSLKFKLFGSKIITGKIEEIGRKSRTTITVNEEKKVLNDKIRNHEEAVKLMLANIPYSRVSKVCYRIVHGGPLKKPHYLTTKVIKMIEEYAELAPLHNIPALRIIKEMLRVLPNSGHIAFFDTSFHQTIPEHIYSYAIPKKLAKKHNIRKYGFHGINHEYLCHQVKEKKVITCHLGNGSSVTAIKNRKSLDTTMGFSPLDGLMMGTRSGDLDPEVILFLMSKEHLSTKKMEEILNTKSGLYGLTGTNDLREVHKKAMAGNKNCKLAIEMLAYSVAKYVNSFHGYLNEAEAIVFSGGIGEDAYYLRKKILDMIPHVKIDPIANRKSGRVISTPDSQVKVYVIKAGEERWMAQRSKMNIA